MTKRVVIIGGGAAGPKTAAKLRREDPDIIIEMYSDEKNISYSACGLPYYIENIIPDINELLVRSPEEFEKHGIRVFLEHRALKIFPKKQMVLFRKKNGEELEVYYDILVLATGARPYIPPIKNIDFKNVFTLRTLEDGVKIKEIMKKSKTATIIGFGYIGIEILEAFVKNGLRVNVIDKNPHIMGMYDDDIAQDIQSYILNRDGDKVKIYNHQYAARFEGHNGIANKVVTTNNDSMDTDFVVICAGIVPNSELAVDAGLKLGVQKSIWVNSHLKTSYPGIYAVGDCCQKLHIVTKKYCWLPLGSTANKEGRCCAINVAGENEEFTGVLGSAVSKYFNFTMSMTGLTETDAKKYGFDPVSVIVRKNDKAGYMPNAKRITLKLVADRTTKRILGAQGIGTGDVDKRINTLTSALLSKMTLHEFVGDDITYAPPFSTSIDLMLNAAQKLIHKLSMH